MALTGNSGSGKSTLASAWAGDLAAVGVPVLILDRENPISAVAERFVRLGVTDGPMFKYCGGWLERGVPRPGSARVVAWVKSCEPKPLVIVDSLAAFHGGDGNDAGEMRAFMQQCRTLADLGATVIVVHHEGKVDTAKDYRGSSDFKAAVDAAFHVSNSPGPDGRLGMIRLRCYKSRFGFTGELIYHYSNGRFQRGQEHDPFMDIAEPLTAILRENPGVEAKRLDQLFKAAKLGLPRVFEDLGRARQNQDSQGSKEPQPITIWRMMPRALRWFFAPLSENPRKLLILLSSLVCWQNSIRKCSFRILAN